MYLFSRADATWTPQEQIAVSDPARVVQADVGLALSADGHTLAMSAVTQPTSPAGADPSPITRAVYVFRHGDTTWDPEATLTVSQLTNTATFGGVIALSSDGNTLIAGDPDDGSGIGGIHADTPAIADTSAPDAGAVFEFTCVDTAWSRQRVIHAPHPSADSHFGAAVALSADASVIAVGAPAESSAATGINSDGQLDTSGFASGAVFVIE
jgi:hypothetical protein